MTRTVKTEEELRIKDLLLTCFHEAGHAVIAMVFDLNEVTITAFRTPNRRGNDEKFIVGQTKAFHICLNSKEQKCFGWAGWVAESLASEPEVEIDQLLSDMYHFIKDEMSDSDRDLLIGASHLEHEMSSSDRDKLLDRADPKELEKTLKKTYALVKKHWPSIAGLAFELAHDIEGKVVIKRKGLRKKRWNGSLKISDVGPFPLLQ